MGFIKRIMSRNKEKRWDIGGVPGNIQKLGTGLGVGLILFWIFSWFSPLLLDDYLEESAYFWRWSQSRSIGEPKKIRLLILGDSQWISGIVLSEFLMKSGFSQEEVLVYAKPSQQLEGIELDLQNLWDMGIDPETYWINISPMSLTASGGFQAFKPMQFFFGEKAYRFLITDIRGGIYRDFGEYIYHGLSYLFPILRYNVQINSVTRFVPSLESVATLSASLTERTGRASAWWNYFNERKEKNSILKKKLGNDGLWEWKNYRNIPEGTEYRRCPNEPEGSDPSSPYRKPDLPIALSHSFAQLRPGAIDALGRIQKKISAHGGRQSNAVGQIGSETEITGHLENQASSLKHSIGESRLIWFHIPYAPQMEKIQTAFPLWLSSVQSTNKILSDDDRGQSKSHSHRSAPGQSNEGSERYLSAMYLVSIPTDLFLESDYSDYTHLNHCGAIRLSTYLGNLVRERISESKGRTQNSRLDPMH